jgi:hypothetical protein
MGTAHDGGLLGVGLWLSIVREVWKKPQCLIIAANLHVEYNKMSFTYWIPRFVHRLGKEKSERSIRAVV